MITFNVKKLIDTWYKARHLALTCPRSLFVSVFIFAFLLVFLSACMSCNFKRLRSSSDASRGAMWWKALCSPLGVGTSSCLPVTFFPFGVNTSRVVTVDVLLGDFSHWAGPNVVDLALFFDIQLLTTTKFNSHLFIVGSYVPKPSRELFYLPFSHSRCSSLVCFRRLCKIFKAKNLKSCRAMHIHVILEFLRTKTQRRLGHTTGKASKVLGLYNIERYSSSCWFYSLFWYLSGVI